MATIKYWDGTAWVYAVVGKQGPVGPTGATGPAGAQDPVVIYLDGGPSSKTPDVIYNAGTAATSSWTYTIDAGGATVTF